MYIKKIYLKNFRNYCDEELHLSPEYNIFFGENGAGKTNILESVSVISSIKSFRGSSDDEMIYKSRDFYYCRGDIFIEENKILEVAYSREGNKKRKKVKINQKEIEKFSDYFGIFLTVVISPDDINLIKGSPEIKRKYFDSYMAKIYSEYTETLLKFRKALTNRTVIIKKIKDGNVSEKKHLDIWNDIFSEEASKIISYRNSFVNSLNEHFFYSYKNISGTSFSPKIKYINSLSVQEKKDILKNLENNYRKEILLGITLQGPQRDNYLFIDDNEEDCTPYFSQGQKRAVALALKCSEIIYIEKNYGKKPVVLVDDIFSELDEKRRKNVFDIFKNNYQVLFTSGNPEFIVQNGFENCALFHVKDGKVVRV